MISSGLKLDHSSFQKHMLLSLCEFFLEQGKFSIRPESDQAVLRRLKIHELKSVELVLLAQSGFQINIGILKRNWKTNWAYNKRQRPDRSSANNILASSAWRLIIKLRVRSHIWISTWFRLIYSFEITFISSWNLAWLLNLHAEEASIIKNKFLIKLIIFNRILIYFD